MRRTFCFLALLLAPLAPAACADWVLGAQKFSFTQERDVSQAEDAAAQQLPLLLMEKITQGMEHVPSYGERLDRGLDALRTERLSLFLQLGAAVQERDALVLSGQSSGSLKKKLASAEKKISGIQQKLEHNSAESARAELSLQADGEEATGEAIVVRDGLVADGQTDGLQGLLSGAMTVYGRYASVTVTLRTYPGGREQGSVTEVGSLDDCLALAARLSAQVVPLVANALPVTLSFSILPQEAAESARVSVDGVLYPAGQADVTVPAGVHQVEVLCDGFATRGFSYAFSGQRQFSVQVSLARSQSFDVSVRLKNPLGVSVYAGGLLAGTTGAGQDGVAITVDGQAVLGRMVSLDDPDAAAFFVIPPQAQTPGAELVVDARPRDVSALIDRRRVWAYRAYSVLMLSLPLTFFFAGNLQSAVSAYNGGSYTDLQAVYAWSAGRYVSLGITAASAVFFVVELVRYLHAAGSVIPAQARAAQDTPQD